MVSASVMKRRAALMWSSTVSMPRTLGSPTSDDIPKSARPDKRRAGRRRRRVMETRPFFVSYETVLRALRGDRGPQTIEGEAESRLRRGADSEGGAGDGALADPSGPARPRSNQGH
jgi:hypothetical protein